MFEKLYKLLAIIYIYIFYYRTLVCIVVLQIAFSKKIMYISSKD